eukprot:9469102-Pyramimonas_sp.AAC.2
MRPHAMWHRQRVEPAARLSSVTRAPDCRAAQVGTSCCRAAPRGGKGCLGRVPSNLNLIHTRRFCLDPRTVQQ